MSVSYFDTLQGVRIATNAAVGLGYAEITKAMRVHVRSLVAEGHVAAFADDDSTTTLDDPKGRVYLTVKGVDYVNLLVEVGLLADMSETVEEPKAAPSRKPTSRRRRSSKPKSQPKADAVVPTPEESVKVAPVIEPKYQRVAPSKKGPQPTGKSFDPSPAKQSTVHTEIPVGERITALEGRLETVTAALEILVGAVR